AVSAEAMSNDDFNTVALTVFAGVALLLAALGIYGVMSYTVAQRTHEIGIRAALGASRADTWKLVASQGMGLALIGLLIGSAASFATSRLLGSLLYGVHPTDPLTFTAMGMVLALTALAACSLPAWRAMRVDPLEALRWE
ncbi:MAG TPA: FtsX-like permease family protein, partial [Bryobacteraceae bacterium]|nr:FtsX-like permease family protein [Bryobacteraceae bacterium]